MKKIGKQDKKIIEKKELNNSLLNLYEQNMESNRLLSVSRNRFEYEQDM